MNRNYSIFTFLLLITVAQAGWAQQAKRPAYKLGWQGLRKESTIDGKEFYRLALQDADNSGKNPVLRLLIEGKSVEAYQLKNAVWRPISDAEKSLIDTISISTEEKISVLQSIQARKPVSIVRIEPFRRNGITHQIEKLLAYDPAITYNTTNSTARTGTGGGPDGVQSDPVVLTPYLATGTWYRIGVTKTGVYKLTGSDLRRMGMTLSGTQVALVGGQGAPLPERIVTDSPEYLKLWAVKPVGTQDGTFDDNDYIAFYAEGVDTWSYNAFQKRYQHNNNIYADTNYYFISLDAGVRSPIIGAAAMPTIQPQQYLTTYSARHLYEKEETNLLKLGKQWLGEPFDFTLNREFNFDTPGRVGDSVTKITVAAAAVSYYIASRFDISVNGTASGRLNIGSVSNPADSPFEDRAKTAATVMKLQVPTSNKVSVKLNYVKEVVNAVGYLDYIEVEDQEALAFTGNQLGFRQASTAGKGVAGFQVSGLNSQTEVWNVTNPAATTQVFVNDQGRFADSVGATPSEFIAFSASSAPSPTLFSKMPAQNLARMTPPNLLIVTHPNFLTEANRLADFRRSHDGLTVEVVTTRQIYNEFSAGKQDMGAIRNFARALYYQPNSAFRYLLLFGDCSFDNKSKMILSNNTPFIPIFEPIGSFHPVYSWATDDFYSFMDKNEGDFTDSDTYDIGVGRLPVGTLTEAKDIVDKMIHYSSNPACLGSWRNSISFVADNGDGLVHMDQAEDLADTMEKYGTAYTPSKIFLPAYPRVAGPGGLTSPELKAAIRQRLTDGALAMNYTGHGSEFQWADEKILDPELINELENMDKLPFFITATCEFGRLDDPSLLSSAEALVVRPNGGGIGVFSACRPVFSYSNYDLNKALYKGFFKRVNGELPRLGDVYLYTKIHNSTQNSNYPFILFADPSLRLNYPQQQVVITAMTDAEGNRIDTVGALSTVKMQGEIRNGADQLDNAFTGTLQVTFYDKKAKINVEDNSNGALSTGSFMLRKNIIFNGTARVANGKWNITFQIPLDINYTFGQGKISMYAFPDQGLVDANGFKLDSLIVGGSSTAEPDDAPPTVMLYMNDTTFRNGGTVGQEATFIARLADNSGINVSQSGIGHEMVAIFSFESGKNRILNDYYITSAGDARKGTVRFPIKDLKPGTYSVSFKAWDLHNNSSSAKLDFVVRPGKCPTIDQIKVIPNPVRYDAEFQASLSQPGGLVDVSVDVYDMLGRKVTTLAKKFDAAPAHLSGESGMKWNSAYDNGSPLQNGTYIYKITAAAEGGCRSQQVGRLVITR